MKSTYLFDGAEKKEKEGLGIAIVTLLAKNGIASRSESRMIVYSDGTSSGTIGGGDVERLIIREASAAIKSGESVRKEYLNRHGGKLDILIDVVSREKKAIIFGSGHVSRALEEVLSFLHFDVSIVDSSLSDSKNGFSSSDADENTALIFTDHANRDRYYLEAKESDAFYIGALSSRVKAVSTDERTFIPSGLDIGAESPEEVAVSIASEIVASLNKRRGISIKEERRRFIIVRGAGDLATAVIIRLKRAGYNVLALETGRPSVIRRTVSLAEAVYEGRAAVEGQEAVLIDSISSVFPSFDEGLIPILIDEKGDSIKVLRPTVVVDAIIAKRNLGTGIDDAPLTIALGPGFTAGVDVDVVIETKRGHALGRIIKSGSAIENTGVPGLIEGYGRERVIHSPSDGAVRNVRKIGDVVEKDEIIAYVGDVAVKAGIGGMLRGLIRDGYECTKGLKIADIDPRGERAEYRTMSDKARSISGAVLEVVDSFFSCPDKWK